MDRVHSMESATSRSSAAIAQVDPASREELAAQLGNLDTDYCLQCGVCSGSCPTASEMAYGPRRIMHMIRLGLVDPVLRSQDIWICVSCYSCAARCPQEIEITDVMSALRNLSLSRGFARDDEAAFSRTFVDVLGRHGRMYEMEVLLRYYAGKPGVTGLIGLLKQATLGLNMFRKRKIALRPERVDNPAELQTIVAKTSGSNPFYGGKKR